MQRTAIAFSILMAIHTVTVAAPSLEQRRQAAIGTAAHQAYCTAIQPFYWEIGDHNTSLVSGQEGKEAPQSTTVMPIASASKWIFGAYVVQRRQGILSDGDIKALTMRAGYTSFGNMSCFRFLPARRDAETVQECFDSQDNNTYTSANEGHFFYNGGHFQYLASKMLGLGDDNNERLATEMRQVLGNGFAFSFGSPQLAGGAHVSAVEYGRFLRQLLDKQLLLGEQLGSHVVCTNPDTCTTALYSPVPGNESWHYSLAHWVEDDPAVGDGSFSSPGAFGFYPWIDAGKQYYGILARHSLERKAYYQSVQCGRLIRRAWLTGEVQP